MDWSENDVRRLVDVLRDLWPEAFRGDTGGHRGLWIREMAPFPPDAVIEALQKARATEEECSLPSFPWIKDLIREASGRQEKEVQPVKPIRAPAPFPGTEGILGSKIEIEMRIYLPRLEGLISRALDGAHIRFEPWGEVPPETIDALRAKAPGKKRRARK